jgi:hypothetical protein
LCLEVGVFTLLLVLGSWLIHIFVVGKASHLCRRFMRRRFLRALVRELRLAAFAVILNESSPLVVGS